MSSSRRRLRNTSTCPTIVNPFNSQPDSQAFLPPSVADRLSSHPNLICSIIEQLPTFINHDPLEQALLLMRRATEWQDNSIHEQTTKTTIPALKQEHTHQMEDQNRIQVAVVAYNGEAELPGQRLPVTPEKNFQEFAMMNRFAPTPFEYDPSHFAYELRPAMPLSDWQHRIHFF